jgi:hypothetical protein
MRNRPPSEEPRPSPEFARFSDALRRILSVSKKELEARLAAERAKKSKQKTSDA